ncbi:exosome non-catalytic core subunit rrp46, partial [Teratosphaeriaceae sp. CCFEE 6253]
SRDTRTMTPEVSHRPLHRADGSAAFSSNLYTVLAAINGPVEVQRRDELPEEAAIEVNIRPAAGVGGPRERWLESVVAAVLRSVLLVHMHPRTLFQVTLQITKAPTLGLRGAVQDVAVLPALINAAFLGLVDGGLPLASTVTAVLFAVVGEGEVKQDPSEKELVGCRSIHALAYTHLHGDLLLNESAGSFDLAEWEHVAEAAEKACQAAVAPLDDGGDEDMDASTTAGHWLRRELEQKAQAAVVWKEAT